MDGSQASTAYLSGNFAPVRSEDDHDLDLSGRFPRDLAGAFYRNGPNPAVRAARALPLVHRRRHDPRLLRRRRKVSYRNRYVRTPKWRLENAAGRALFNGFDPRGADPSAIGTDSGVANTNSSGTAIGCWRSKRRTGRSNSIRSPSNRGGMSKNTRAGSPRIPRSIPRPAKWSGSAIPSATGRSRYGFLWRDRRARRVSGATISRRRFRAWCMIFWSPGATSCFRSCR